MVKIHFFQKFLTSYLTTSYENQVSRIEYFFRIKCAGTSNYKRTSHSGIPHVVSHVLETSFDKLISPIHFEKPTVACAIGVRRGRVNQNEQKMQNEPNLQNGKMNVSSCFTMNYEQ